MQIAGSLVAYVLQYLSEGVRLLITYFIPISIFLISSFLASALLKLVYWSQLWPKLWSPLRHLPQAPNPTFWQGNFGQIIKEPTGSPMREWINSVPNDGLIRYLANFNIERVLLTNPESLREVLVTKCYDFVKPSLARRGLGQVLGYGLILAEGDDHKRQRKHLMPAFHYRQTRNLVPTFWRFSANMVDKAGQEHAHTLRGEADGAIIDFSSLLSRCLLDTIGIVGMGIDFAATGDPSNELSQAYEKVFAPSKTAKYLRLISMFLPPSLEFIIRAIPLARNNDMAWAARTIRAASRKAIAEKKRLIAAEHKTPDHNQTTTTSDILGTALKSNQFTPDNLVDQAMTFLAAGHDTTSSSVSWALYELARHPEMQDRLRAEIHSQLPNPHAPSSQIPIPTAEALESCRYLSAVCNEVLRYHAPVPMTVRVADKNTSILGTPIRKGTFVIICPAAINFSSALWGAGAGDFDPGRWLSTTGQQQQQGPGEDSTTATSNFAFLTFNHGPRSCIGARVARLQIASLLACMVGRFRFELEDKGRVAEVQYSGVTAKIKGGLPLRVWDVGGWE